MTCSWPRTASAGSPTSTAAATRASSTTVGPKASWWWSPPSPRRTAISVACPISSSTPRGSPRPAARAAWSSSDPQTARMSGGPCPGTVGAMRCAAATVVATARRPRPAARSTSPSDTTAVAASTGSSPATATARSAASQAPSASPSLTSADAAIRYACTRNADRVGPSAGSRRVTSSRRGSIRNTCG
ncbi:hypothetical protein ACIG49_20015 [Micromonospora rosaria]|uniref:hypothetical protein n=1 Tax=Micromonospora rosaria TaxID=47874 RepID=UPI001FDF3F07|nr:hypothetical protein [Micromonospora rosaria]